jgi:hypothetical protein
MFFEIVYAKPSPETAGGAYIAEEYENSQCCLRPVILFLVKCSSMHECILSEILWMMFTDHITLGISYCPNHIMSDVDYWSRGHKA